MALYGYIGCKPVKVWDLLPGGRVVPDQPDLHLMVATGNRKRKVAAFAFVLKEASPVFNAMLCGPWKESQDYAEADGQRPTKIMLPDDHPEGMRLLCAILTMEKYPTFGYSELKKVTCDKQPSLWTLQQAAILAEKYLVLWYVKVKRWDNLMYIRSVPEWLYDDCHGRPRAQRTVRLLRRFGAQCGSRILPDME